MDARPPQRSADTGSEPPAPFAERLRLDVAMLCDLFDRGIEVDGDAVLTAGPRWIIYGRTTYDGEMILAEYDDPEEAAAVILSLPERITRGR